MSKYYDFIAHHGKAFDLGLELIESEARTILKNHSQFDEFIMAMGAAFFTQSEERYMRI